MTALISVTNVFIFFDIRFIQIICNMILSYEIDNFFPCIDFGLF